MNFFVYREVMALFGNWFLLTFDWIPVLSFGQNDPDTSVNYVYSWLKSQIFS